MAHADYECCAVCDRKMAYGGSEYAKESICAECAVDVSAAAGERITTPEALIDWIGRKGDEAVAVLNANGFRKCFYPNPVDAAFNAAALARAATTSPATGAEGEG